MQADTLQENIHLQTGWIRQGHSESLVCSIGISIRKAHDNERAIGPMIMAARKPDDSRRTLVYSYTVNIN